MDRNLLYGSLLYRSLSYGRCRHFVGYCFGRRLTCYLRFCFGSSFGLRFRRHLGCRLSCRDGLAFGGWLTRWGLGACLSTDLASDLSCDLPARLATCFAGRCFGFRGFSGNYRFLAVATCFRGGLGNHLGNYLGLRLRLRLRRGFLDRGFHPGSGCCCHLYCHLCFPACSDLRNNKKTILFWMGSKLGDDRTSDQATGTSSCYVVQTLSREGALRYQITGGSAITAWPWGIRLRAGLSAAAIH